MALVVFKLLPPVLGLRASEFVHKPFKSDPQHLGSPESKSFWFSKANVNGAHLPDAGPQSWGA